MERPEKRIGMEKWRGAEERKRKGESEKGEERQGP